jgi:hypothetical protein
VNYTPVTADAERAQRDAKYALDIAHSYVEQMPEGRAFLAEKTIVEFGPGINLGTALILACWGARQVTVCDRFQVSFQHNYHVPVYKAIIDLLLKESSAVNISPLRTVLERGSHITPELRSEACALEELAERYPCTFDISLSNAVFEHLYHPLQAFNSLYSCMSQGSRGYHQVDFRDHRDFTKPLEYLLIDEFSFHVMMRDRHCECGNRLRPHQMRSMFENAGFSQVEFYPNMWAEPTYLEDFIPRLRASGMSSYSHLDTDLLKIVSGRFVVVK